MGKRNDTQTTVNEARTYAKISTRLAHGGSRPVRRRAPFIESPPLIVQDDAGRYRLGIHDDATPGFESRGFAADVLRHRRTRHSDLWIRQ